jgi:hypothetical protein
MAINQSPGIFQSIVELAARRLDEMSGNRFGNWLKDSTGMTSLPGFLSRPNFGVATALQSTRKAPRIGDMLVETVNYAIDEARERLSALVNGGFIPGTVIDLYEYLKEHSYELETRINKITGEVVNFLVDKTSKQAVPAAQVDPSLSHRNVLKLELASRLREQIGSDTPAAAYGSWSGMSWTRDSIQSRFGYTVEGKQGYFGRVVGIASDDERENQGLLSECAARGIDVIVPTNPDTGMPVVGMPILARSKSMKAEEVDRGLDHAALSARFGTDMITHFVKLGERANSPRVTAAAATSISSEDFSRMFLRQEKDIEPPDMGFGFIAADQDLDIVVKTDRRGNLRAWDRASNSDYPSAINCLPYGEYERFDADGKLAGYTTVGDNGAVAQYDLKHRVIEPQLPRARADEEEYGRSPSYGFH